jgi:hypothetical protein
VNQPRLEQALRAWDATCGPIVEVEGMPGVYRYGFLPVE